MEPIVIYAKARSTRIVVGLYPMNTPAPEDCHFQVV